jgi:hypothetical protein
MNRKYYLIPLTVVLACFLLAFVMRNSYTDVNQGVYQYRVGGNGDWGTVFQQEKIHSVKDLTDRSDLIVRAKFSGKRLIRDTGFYSTVQACKVYKGDQSLKGKEIIVTESLYVKTETKFINETLMPMWIPLQKDSEYLLLLKKVPFHSQRTLNDFQRSQYYPVTNSPAGCYRVSNSRQTKIMDPDKVYTIKNLQGMDLFAVNRQVLNTYYQYKEQVFKMVGA